MCVCVSVRVNGKKTATSPKQNKCDQSVKINDAGFVAKATGRLQHDISMIILHRTFKCTAAARVTQHYKILNNHTVTSHQTHTNMREVRQCGYVRKPPDSQRSSYTG